MKWILLLLLLVTATGFSQSKSDTLTNEKVIKMAKNGISDVLIFKMINSAKYYRFDLSSDGLIDLKKNKISDSIIVVLFDKVNGAAPYNTVSSNPVPASKKPVNATISNAATGSNLSVENLSGMQPGFYFVNEKQKLVKLSGIRSSMQIGTRISLINSAKWFYEFNGDKAMLSSKNNEPEFFLVTGTNQSGTVFEPTRFVLINVEVRKGKREIYLNNGIIGQRSLGGPSSFDEKDGMVTPIFTEFGDNVYKVTFGKKLPIGSYFFAPSQIARDMSLEFFEFDIVK